MYGILLTSRWIGFFNIVKYTHLTWVFLHQLQNFTNKKQKKIQKFVLQGENRMKMNIPRE